MCAVGPLLGFLTVVWWLDRYDREPIAVLALVFAWSATAGALAAMLGNTAAWGALAFLSPVTREAIAAVAIAPLVEEPAKALVLVGVVASGHLDEATDGFVYGAAAGLGFAMTENFLYFRAATEDGVLAWASLVVVRTFFSAVMHGLASAAVGAAVGWTWYERGLPRLLGVVGGLAAAMTLHALWNGLLTADLALGGTGALASIDQAVLAVVLLAWLVLFEVCLHHESATLRRELEEEAAVGTLPHAHAAIVASWWRRIGRGWLPDGVSHDAYVRAATRLALARRMHRLATGTRQEAAAVEIIDCRAALRSAATGLPA